MDVLSKIGPDVSRKVTSSGLLLQENVKIRIVNRLGSGEYINILSVFHVDNILYVRKVKENTYTDQCVKC